MATNAPWIKIAKTGSRGEVVYCGRDAENALAAMTEPFYVYDCYTGKTENGPWYWLGPTEVRALGLKTS